MKKIPVLATIRDAYRFTFTHVGAIIGLIWLPMFLITVIGFFVWKRYLDAMADALASGNYAATGPQSLGVLCYFIGALLLVTMMSVPMTQLALGTRKEGALVHFALGGVEWRLFRGAVSLVGLLLMMTMLLAVAATALGSLGGSQRFMIPLALGFLATFAYFALRFGLVMPALAANENEPLLQRAWALTAGNSGRLLIVAVAVLGPLWLLSTLAQMLVEGPVSLTPNLQSSTAMLAAEIHLMAQQMPLVWGVKFLIAPLQLGLALGAGASIYRALTGEKIA
jgi:hypothetical protein